MMENPKSRDERVGVMGLWRVAVALTLAAAVSACGSNAPTGPSTPTRGAGRRTASWRLRDGADDLHAA